ncbi:MAG: UDP-N-acetylglucosamine 2-epimerase (non-hydrolyzing) [Candidatus Schekmanbacteria bacterium]|nr:MAG: UDP-N-acetylglucosamine 2-epimerase (non-hydrolyzing) [Candidatus Schekmanbacteria bacterium]
MKKILFLFGTRPEAIKLAPVILKLRECKKYKVRVCVTAQHREMLDQVISLFKIKPHYDLNLMRQNQSLEEITSRLISSIEPVLRKEKPDFVFVQGDTTTTFTAALAAFYQRIPVAHIEAGLRTNDIYQPFPEEINRRLTSSIASIHFAPTKESKQNLIREGISRKKIYVTGNTVIDALLYTIGKVEKKKRIPSKLKIIDFNKKVILVTGHRRENFGKGFENICTALKSLSNNKDIEIVYPVHLNPNVQKPVKRILGNIDNIKLIEPLDYFPFVYLMSKSYFIITDSGGIQEEAPSIGKPVLVMRNKTERPEALKAGTVKLVGTDRRKIEDEANKLINNKKYYLKMARAHNPYGDGKASQRIVSVMEKL